MAERALALTAPLVLAVMQGRKDVTRRPLKALGPPTVYAALPPYMAVPESGRRQRGGLWGWLLPDVGPRFVCPLGAPGDAFWIREPARVLEVGRRVRGYVRIGLRKGGTRVVRVRYLADGFESDWLPYPDRLAAPVLGKGIANGVHREGARTFADLVSVGAERVQSITEDDARREGCQGGHGSIPGYNFSATPLEHFRHVWTSIYGEQSYEQGWCWRLELRRREARP